MIHYTEKRSKLIKQTFGALLAAIGYGIAWKVYGWELPMILILVIVGNRIERKYVGD